MEHQDHNPLKDEKFNGSISSRVKKFHVDEGWVFINTSKFALIWVITKVYYNYDGPFIRLGMFAPIFVPYHFSPLPHV